MRAEAKKWAKHYQERGSFPEPKLIPVPPGSMMICNGIEADIIAFGASAHKPRWFFYLVDFLRMEANPSSPAERPAFHSEFEAFACRYPWGALAVATHFWESNIDRVARRLEAVLSFWEQLDTLRYLRRRQYTLADFMRASHEGTLRMWVDSPTGSVKDDLRAAMERMRQASEDEIQTRMMRHLHELVDTEPELTHREWLKSPGVLEVALAHDKEMSPEAYDNFKMDNMDVCSSFLRYLDSKYPDGLPPPRTG